MRNPGRIKPLNPREPCTAKPQQQRPEPKRTSPHNLDKPKPKPTRTKPNLFINNLTSLSHLQLPHLPHSPSTTPTTSSNPREALLHPLLPLLWLPSFDPESNTIIWIATNQLPPNLALDVHVRLSPPPWSINKINNNNNHNSHHPLRVVCLVLLVVDCILPIAEALQS